MMKRTLATSAFALAATMTAAGAAHAECDVMMQDYDAQLVDRPEYRAQISPAVQRDIRQLRDAAYILDHHDKGDVCEEVVAAIQDLIENPDATAEQSGS
jgi:hypothetical protein